MLWFFLQKNPQSRAYRWTSNTPLSPEGWENRNTGFSQKSPVLLPLWGRGKIRPRQVRQIQNRFTKSKALPLPPTYGMLAKICQRLWELLRAQGSCILLPLNSLAQRSLFNLLETGTSAHLRHCWELWGLPAWHCWTEQTVFFSDCTKLNLDYGAEIYIYFIIDFIKSSTRKQKLWAMQHLNRSWEWRSNF